MKSLKADVGEVGRLVPWEVESRKFYNDRYRQSNGTGSRDIRNLRSDFICNDYQQSWFLLLEQYMTVQKPGGLATHVTWRLRFRS